MNQSMIPSENYLAFVLCVEPTLYDGLKFAKDLIIVNIVFRIIVQNFRLPKNMCHLLSLLLGASLLYYSIGIAFFWTIGLTLLAYVTILILIYTKINYKGYIVLFFTILFLFVSEMCVISPKMWQQIRGIQMIAAMKIISVTFDLDANLFKYFPNPVKFVGYVLCPANCILGPWIPFSTYENYMAVKFLSYKTLATNLAYYLLLALIFLISSNCLIPLSIEDSSFKWFLAYRDALSFRMSHYFISKLSVVCMVCAGFELNSDYVDTKVTHPYHIEFPRSLSQVVINWNVPMHQWLKKYVFKTCQSYGQFTAVTATYFVSSMLHGVNFQLSAVLLSIGIFSYVEYKIRIKISSLLNACCLANPCLKKCNHIYKKKSVRAVVCNFIFFFITMINLAYLGVMFEASFLLQETGYSYYHLFTKWRQLNFFCHILILIMYFITFLEKFKA